MNEENVKRIIDLVEQGISNLAEKMGIAVPQLWEILVRQQFVYAIGVFVVLLVSFLLSAILFKISYKMYKEKNDIFGDDDFLVPGAVASLIFIVAFIFFAAEGADLVGRFLNPEYYAIVDIVNFIKGGNL